MLKVGGIYSLNNINMFVVILDKGYKEYYGFCFFSSSSNNDKLKEIIEKKIKKYSTIYDNQENYLYWFYEKEQVLNPYITGYVGKVDEKIEIYGRTILNIAPIEQFQKTYDYFLKKCRCNNCKYLISTLDYTGTEPYYICTKNDEITGYRDDMVEYVCEQFKM